MPKVTITQPHTIEVTAAKEKVVPVLQETITAFNGTGEEIVWSENSATFSFKSMGFTIKGTGQVDSTQVVIEIELPFAAMMFKDKVQKSVQKRLAKALEQP